MQGVGKQKYKYNRRAEKNWWYSRSTRSSRSSRSEGYDAGEAGPQGTEGPQGIQGLKGEVGDIGPKGDNAPLVIAQYSIDGISGWTDLYDSSCLFIRFSNDGGAIWGGCSLVLQGHKVYRVYKA